MLGPYHFLYVRSLCRPFGPACGRYLLFGPIAIKVWLLYMYICALLGFCVCVCVCVLGGGGSQFGFSLVCRSGLSSSSNGLQVKGGLN